MPRLQGKIALVTAAGQGIGRATALAFAAEGARVWATDVESSKLANVRAEAGIEVRRLDVTDAAAVSAVTDEIGAVDVVFNCAGWAHSGTAADTSEGDWLRTFDINVHGMYRVIRAVLPDMIARGGGTIINVASVVSSITSAPNRAAYGASKGAVIGLTKSVAVDFAAKGIRCNAICPGTIDTPSLQERIQQFQDPAAARAAFVTRQRLGRLGKAEEVAALAVYLASDESAFATGSCFVIDGGMSL
jgi:2-keto-3-deoxy-L-fuconate dehydrogenase